MSNSKVIFKEYDSNQLMLLPPNLSDIIPSDHPVRVINHVIDRIDLALISRNYKGGGTSSYHPRMLLKVLVYGYVNNVYSSRKLESMCKENIHMMWLSAMNTPDHNTINRFRGDKLKGVLKEVFTQVVLLLSESGHLDLQKAYTDGTKIEANANKYTFVWGNSIKTNKEKMVKQLEELWEYSQKVAEQESTELSVDTTKLTAEMLEKTLEKIETNLSTTSTSQVDKKKKQKLTYAKKNWPSKLREYKEKESILNDRNSYSKTDTDATFMRMKEDHMQNGQLKAAYNLQISTNDQYILHYSIHQKPTDTTTLIPHLESFKEQYKQLPKVLTADAGYGSEENYEYLEKQEIEAYVKYNHFHKEQRESKKIPQSLQSSQNLHYNKEKDEYTCPMGQKMKNIGSKKNITKTGYEQTYSRYQAQNCQGCPLRSSCHKSKRDRIVEVNHRLNYLKINAKQNLLSEEGIKHRKQRPADVEAVFGNLKQNMGIKRFSLRGLEKVEIEMGLAAIAHNLKKVA